MRGLSGDFWKFWVGQTISNLGSSFTRFALPLLVYKLTGSALNLGLMTAVSFLPYLLFGLVIGAWVDRANRKRLMILADIAQAIVISSIPLLAGLGLLTVWWIYAAGFVSSTLGIFFESGEFAAIPNLVSKGELVRANGRIQASYSAARVLGPLLAGLLVNAMSIPWIFLFDALSFLVSALALSLIGISFNTPGERKTPTSTRADIAEGLRYVLGHPILRNISMMMALINFISATKQAQLVLFAKERLGASDFQVSLLYSAGSAGIIVLSLAANPLRKRLSFSKAALGALMLSGLLTIVLSLVQLYWAALLLWAPIMGLAIFFNINTLSLRQEIVPGNMLGRVISIAGVLAWSSIPLGAFLGGLAIEQTQNVALVYGTIGVLVFLVAFAFSFTALGRAERYLAQEKTPEDTERVSVQS